MKHSVRVMILGQEYTVRSEAEPEDVLQVAEQVNRRIAEAQRGAGAASSYTAVVLALLNVAGDLHQVQRRQIAGEDAERRLRNLLERLETFSSRPDDGDPGNGS